MIQWFYTELGFAGTILVALFIFVMFILWLAGIAGISGLPESNRSRTTKLFLGVLLPPFPIGWILWDIRRQHRIIKGSRRESYDSN